MSDYVGTVLYLAPDAPGGLAELATKAGGAPVGVDGGVATLRWLGLPASAEVHDDPALRCLLITYPQSAFVDRVLFDDDATFKAGFLKACRALKARVGWVAGHPLHIEEAFRREREWMVVAGEANLLADERFSLLFLDADAARLWKSTPQRDDRDVELLSGGARLAFAGKGAGRWGPRD